MVLTEKLQKLGKEHLVDTTALLSVSTPIASTLETHLIGLEDEISLNMRAMNALLLYGGIGSIITRGRDKVRECLNISQESDNLQQFAVDTGYIVGFQMVGVPLMYLAAGGRSLEEMTYETLMGSALAVAVGGVSGYVVDTFRDLTGIQESKRLPSTIKELPQAMKRVSGGALVGAAIGLSALSYYTSEDRIDYLPSYESIIHDPSLKKVTINYNES